MLAAISPKLMPITKGGTFGCVGGAVSACAIVGNEVGWRPDNPLRISDGATADELRAEIMKRVGRLVSAGVTLPLNQKKKAYKATKE
jgi:hypothetical protein